MKTSGHSLCQQTKLTCPRHEQAKWNSLLESSKSSFRRHQNPDPSKSWTPTPRVLHSWWSKADSAWHHVSSCLLADTASAPASLSSQIIHRILILGFPPAAFALALETKCRVPWAQPHGEVQSGAASPNPILPRAVAGFLLGPKESHCSA